MNDRNPYPPPDRPGPPPEDGGPAADPAAASESGSEVARVTAALEGDLSARLAALDRLYETKQITATELGEARRRLLAGTDPPAPPRADAGGAAPPLRREPEHIGAPSPPPERRVAGLPVWAATAIGIVLVAAIAVAVIFLVRGGDDDSAPAADEGPAYIDQIRAPLDRLTASAVAIGKTLGRASEPDEIPAVKRAADRQLDVVEAARRNLAEIEVVGADRRAHAQLIRAAAEHRRYLVQLGRATSGEPSPESLAATNRARRTAAATVRAYRTFFTLVPQAPDAITGTDLADLAGLRAAIRQAVDAAREPTPAPAPTAPVPPRVYSGPSFQSPTGNLRCQVSGSYLFCSSSNDGFGVTLPDFGTPYTGSGIASGGVTVPYGSTWSNGVFSCDSAFNGITCRNGSGNGFFLNRDTYNSF